MGIKNRHQNLLVFTASITLLIAACSSPDAVKASEITISLHGIETVEDCLSVEKIGVPGPPYHLQPLQYANTFSVMQPDSSDRFGYYWEDSRNDTTAFRWIEIYETGDKIYDPGDDRNHGPFDLPFDFRFYTGEFGSIRICTNGWMSFSSRSYLALPQDIPMKGEPDNLIASLWTDLDPSKGGGIYTWESSGRDSFIVEFYRIPSYGGGGEYTFQTIFTENGDIGLQYLSVITGTDETMIGIEGPYGRDGLCLSSHEPFPTDSLRIQIRRPEPYSIDVGALAITSPRSWVPADESQAISCDIFNFGTEDNVPTAVRADITSLSSGQRVFSREEQLIMESSFESESMEFLEEWLPSSLDSFRIDVITSVEGDQSSWNDTISAVIHSVAVDSDAEELSCDSGATGNAWAFLHPGGVWAVRFTPEEYPCRVIGAKARFHDGWPDTTRHDVLICMYDDNGANGSPGDLLAGPLLLGTGMGSSADWDTIPLPSRTLVEEGDFFLGIMQELVFPNCNAVFVDGDSATTRSWMMDPLTEEWNILGNEYGNLLLRALVIYGTGCPLIEIQARSTAEGLLLWWDLIPEATGYNIYTEELGEGNRVRLNSLPLLEARYVDGEIAPGESRIYRIGLPGGCGAEQLSSPFTFSYMLSPETGATGIVLHPPSPNPFNPLVRISFSLPRDDCSVTLEIYDTKGRSIRTLIDDRVLPAGTHIVTWDGRSDRGEELPSGIYFYRLVSERGVIGTRRLLLLK